MALLAEARRTLAQAERAVDIAWRAGQGEVGRVRIGFLASACNNVLPPVIRAFRRHFPNVALELDELLDEEQLRRLVDAQLDVGFLRAVPADLVLQSEVVLMEPLAAALPERLMHILTLQAGNSELSSNRVFEGCASKFYVLASPLWLW
jgi:DNA-binding transcriptional LysR family regulator